MASGQASIKPTPAALALDDETWNSRMSGLAKSPTMDDVCKCHLAQVSFSDLAITAELVGDLQMRNPETV
jgi:hypothetical protein